MNFFRANLSNTDLLAIDLNNADLIDAFLTNAQLIDADLTGAKLMNANLTKADLSNAKSWKANVNEAIFSRTVISNNFILNVENIRIVQLEGCLIKNDSSEKALPISPIVISQIKLEMIDDDAVIPRVILSKYFN